MSNRLKLHGRGRKKRVPRPSEPFGRRLLGTLGRALRNVVLFIVLVGAVVGFKAWQNRRDVVAVEPIEQVLLAMTTASPSIPGTGGTSADATMDRLSFRIADPYSGSGHWHKVQLHMHTDRSIDGRWSVDEALTAYRAAGYGFVAITDHDKVTVPERVPPGLVIIPAEENTVSFPFWPLGQHAIHLFAAEHVKHGTASDRFEAMTSTGGLVSIAHPHWPGNLDSGRWEPKHLLAAPQFTFMEVSNPYSNPELDTKIWHEMVVRRGPDNPVWAVAVDDAHEKARMNLGWTMVRTEEHSLAGLRDALLRGSLYPTTGPLVSFGTDQETIVVAEPDTATPGQYTVLFIDKALRVVGRHEGSLPASYHPTGTEGFVRVEVVDLETGKRAWSQPFWLLPAADEG